MAPPPFRTVLVATLILVTPGACDGSGGGDGSDAPDRDAASELDAVEVVRDAAPEDGDPDPGPAAPRSFVAVTFNPGTAGTTGGAYTAEHAAVSDAWYGNGLAWRPAVEAARAFFATVDPDLVAFQEIFWSGRCTDIPEAAREDFVCETWRPGDPTVARAILAGDWQVACHPGKPDKCAAVNRRFGSFRGCDGAFCLEGLDGGEVEGCGSGSRIGRGIVDLVGGGSLTVVNVHGTSGFIEEDEDCRTKQFEQVFVDLGDGAPAASGERNLIMGDLNTDPGRLAEGSPSARRLLDFVGEGLPFHFVTEIGEDAAPTYGGFVNIDHVMSDAFEGDCWAAGISEGRPPVLESPYFDHAPIVCTLR